MNSDILHFNDIKLYGSAIPVAVCCSGQAVSGTTKLGAPSLITVGEQTQRWITSNFFANII